jgi:hypothetical protein
MVLKFQDIYSLTWQDVVFVVFYVHSHHLLLSKAFFVRVNLTREDLL